MTVPIPSQTQGRKFCGGVETVRAAPVIRIPDYGEETVQTTNDVTGVGGESRSGMNPGAVGSNPAADTITSAPLSPCYDSMERMTGSCWPSFLISVQDQFAP